MFSESEKPWIATDTLPWPPRHLRPYIEQDYTQDWEIVDDSIPDDLRKEFEEWYKTKFLEAVKWENERYERQLEQDRYDEIWLEREEALWSSKKKKKIKFRFEYCYTIGFIATEVPYDEMSLEELEEYVKILNEAHANWLAVVKKQEEIPGYLPDDFYQKNLEKTIRTFNLVEDISFEEIMELVEGGIAEINKFYNEKISKTEEA
jgi:hypothetical protein